MSPAPASTDDLKVFRKAYLEKLGTDMDQQRAVIATPPTFIVTLPKFLG